MTLAAWSVIINRMTAAEHSKLKEAFEVARVELELATAKFDAAAAHDNTRKHLRAYDLAAGELKAAAEKLKHARTLIEAAIEVVP